MKRFCDCISMKYVLDKRFRGWNWVNKYQNVFGEVVSVQDGKRNKIFNGLKNSFCVFFLTLNFLWQIVSMVRKVLQKRKIYFFAVKLCHRSAITTRLLFLF